MMNKLKNLSVLFTILLTTALLTACGAARDGSGPVAEITDRTGPTLEKVEPNFLASAIGDTAIIPVSTKKITFTFSEALDPASIPSKDSLSFVSSSGVLLKGDWSYPQNSASPFDLIFTFDLSSIGTTELPLDETYRLSFVDILTDTQGNKYDSFTLSFQTAQSYDLQVATSGLADNTIEIKIDYSSQSKAFSIVGDGTNNFSSVLDTNLIANTAFTLSISSQPNNETFCAFSNTLGGILEADADVSLNCSNVIPYYTDASNWNSYKEVISDTPLIHGGERRKFKMASYYACDQLATPTDSLDAFDWSCKDDGSTTTIFSTGLKDGKYLSDLLDFTAKNWRENTVSVFWSNHNANPIVTTASAIWWNNPVTVPNSEELSDFETIYILTGIDSSDPSLNRAYRLTERHTALIVDPNFTLTSPTSSREQAAITVASTGVWVEGAVNAKESKTGLLITNGVYTQIHNFDVSLANNNGIEIILSERTYLIDVTSSDNGTNGLNIVSPNTFSSFGNIIHNATLNANTENGLLVETTTINNRLSGITANENGLNGIVLSSNNYLSDSAINTSKGNALSINGHNNIITSLVANTTGADAGGIVFDLNGSIGPKPKKNILSSILASSIVDNTKDTLIFESNVLSNIVNTANGESIVTGMNTPPSSFIDHEFVGGNIVSYLDNAIEPFNDNSGNDNGLCEANEKCLFTQNTGAIQGSGELSLIEENTLWTGEDITLEQYATP